MINTPVGNVESLSLANVKDSKVNDSVTNEKVVKNESFTTDRHPERFFPNHQTISLSGEDTASDFTTRKSSFLASLSVLSEKDETKAAQYSKS